MSPAASQKVRLIIVTVKDSNEIHSLFSRFTIKNCNINESWKAAFDRAGIRLNASEYEVISAGKLVSSGDLNSKIKDFVGRFKKRPGYGEYKVFVKKIKGQPSRQSSLPQTKVPLSKSAEIFASTLRTKGERDAETVKIPTFSNGLPTDLPPRRFPIFDEDDDVSQFAESTNEAEAVDENKAHKYTQLNALVLKRLNETMVYQDRMFLVQEELKAAFDSEKWEKLTTRFPTTSHFLLKLFRPYTS